MPPWNRRRAAALNRRADGTFGPWKGGARLADLPKKENTYQGIAVHIGAQFKKQNGRTAKVGELHRTRKADGSFHRQAAWYVLTRHGWRKSPTLTRKPSPAQVRTILEGARPGRLT